MTLIRMCFFFKWLIPEERLLPTPRAASHTRLRARDHYTSSTVIIGKDGAGPGLLHTTLEGPTEYVNARWMSSLHGFLHGIEWIMFYITWTIFKNHFLEVGLTQNPKIMALWTFTTVDFFSILSCVRTCMNRNSLKQRLVESRSHMTSHYTWGFVTTHDFGGVLGWPLDTFFWALTISWSWCGAKPTILKRPSPGDGFENHMYLLELEPCAK